MARLIVSNCNMMLRCSGVQSLALSAVPKCCSGGRGASMWLEALVEFPDEPGTLKAQTHVPCRCFRGSSSAQAMWCSPAWQSMAATCLRTFRQGMHCTRCEAVARTEQIDDSMS